MKKELEIYFIIGGVQKKKRNEYLKWLKNETKICNRMYL